MRASHLDDLNRSDGLGDGAGNRHVDGAEEVVTGRRNRMTLDSPNFESSCASLTREMELVCCWKSVLVELELMSNNR